MGWFGGWVKRLLNESPPVTSPDEMKTDMTRLMNEIKSCYDQIAQLRHENEVLKQEIEKSGKS